MGYAAFEPIAGRTALEWPRMVFVSPGCRHVLALYFRCNFAAFERGPETPPRHFPTSAILQSNSLAELNRSGREILLQNPLLVCRF